MGRWVMTARKVIMVEKKREQHGGIISVETAARIYAVGDEAPAGHERRPYTRYEEDALVPRVDMGEQRIEEPAPNRMQKPGRKRKAGAA